MNKKELKSIGARLKSLQTNKGITLIALIITIIVMLILASVTITVAINGGLFEYAGKAVGETKNAINAEQQFINDIIKESFGSSSGGGTGGETGNTLPTYANASKEANGILKENATYTSGAYTATIPKGFKVLETEGITIEGGLVITDSNEKNADGENIGNQFVWIPVEKAIVTESEIAKRKADSGNTEMTDLEAVQLLVDSGTYPMAVQDGADYKGILYDFTHNSDNTLTLTVLDWTNTDSYREPAVLSSYDTQANFETHGLGTYSDDLYQNAYNKMVQGVAKNGGFYVGRYEISLYTDSENSTIKYAQTKKDQTALVSTTWYEMYKYERDYAYYNTNLGVTSEMIWGSQWDQMMIFVNGKNDGVGAKFYVATSGSRGSGDSSIKTGMHSVDQVANLFDLEARRYEWTQEAYSSAYRVFRGSNYYGGSRSASTRFPGDGPGYGDLFGSSRASLYIK